MSDAWYAQPIYPTHEVWGGFIENGECDDPRHLEDCFSEREAERSAIEWAGGQGRYAFVRAKDGAALSDTSQLGKSQ